MYKQLKLKLHSYLNRYKFLQNKFDKVHQAYEEYKDYSEGLDVRLQQLEVQLRETGRERDEYKEQRDKAKKKLLTLEENEYTLDIPRLDIKKVDTALKTCDPFLLNMLIELIKIDTWEMTKSLANSLEDKNKYEISIIMNTIRRRQEAWLWVLEWAVKRKTMYADKGEGKMKQKK